MEIKTVSPALGDCPACFEAVCNDARDKFTSEWAWQIDAKASPYLCHWAREVGEVTTTNGPQVEREIIFDGACGRKFSRPSSLLESRACR